MTERLTPRSIAIVGNAPDMADQGGRIDAADWVVRFNNASGFGAHAGRRVTHLALVNHGGQMREWLDDPGFISRPVVRAAGSILFPFARKAGPLEDPDADGRCWTAEAEARLGPLGSSMTILPFDVHRKAEAILRTRDRPYAVPSTGFLVALHVLSALPASTRVGLYGFGFAGWSGHHWQGERAHFEALRKAGRLDLHPLDEPLSA
ncbi:MULTISPECIES: glycosyltransferase family 29 protein [unclassified Aureimonas]|uniref:glycosyltransferase family 29 protein n=1 Tax=unclassified Aureimonas TaxID=2615206 RepID=UPI0006FA807C|nr:MULTISPECIES: glycosyltransferase family 29 protein [unclassified Aureimonas]KQT68930.1 hypothetical protein ASG54_04510 [Aureimonas sp. Leaf460]KQT69157.1 hypothetical protein ASG62_17115 [Aureimonas sp. Leaf427]